MADVINLISSDEEHPTITPARRSTPPAAIPSSTGSDDGIELISHIHKPPTSSAPKREKPDHIISKSRGRSRMFSPPRAMPLAQTEEPIELVTVTRGVQALVDYPHFRFQCALEPFKRARANKKEKYCVRCFCYVCDIPAAECIEWSVHSKAVDTVPRWRAKRDARLEERRRRQQCLDSNKRGTLHARMCSPQMTGRQGSSEEMDDEPADESDAMEWREGRHDSEEEEEQRCALDDVLPLDRLVVDECFSMVGLEDAIKQGVERSSRIRARNPVLHGSMNGFDG